MQVCYCGNVTIYDTELVYPEIASLLLSRALQCALWISNLRQYSFLGRGFCSEDACESRAGNFEAVKLVIFLSSDFFMGLGISKN